MSSINDRGSAMVESTFALTANLPAKTVAFTPISPNPHSSTADGDPNSGIIASNAPYDPIV
jgi:hypothetical protein